MSEPLKIALRSAVLRILEPLVKWLLEAGMGVGDFLALVKLAYVHAARDAGQQAGGEAERPNVSRIAVVTGLTRAEVTNLLASAEAERPSDRGRQRAERVLSGWWNDSEFHDSTGNPALLPIRGRGRTFASLVDRYSGERLLAGSILEALLRVKAVRRRPDGKLEAISRTYATVRWDPDGVIAMGEQLSEHCATLLHNLKHPARARYVARVINAQLDPRYVPMLVRDIQEQAAGLAESTDDALNAPAYTLRGTPHETGAVSLGVGIYFFETTPMDAENLAQPTRAPRSRRGKRKTGRRR